jgi:predicted transcriptional regulator
MGDDAAPPELHSLESEIMAVIWDTDGEVAVRDVLEAINDGADKPRAYTTVMTVMSRLDDKGLLSRRRQGKTDLYSAVLTREAYRQERARVAVGAFVDEFGDLALVQFARHVDALDPGRRRALRRLAKRDEDA